MSASIEKGGASSPFLTADEVEADPTVLRNPDARQKQRNRDGQAAGVSKMSIGGVFSWRLIEMQESPAYRVLSLSARRVLDRLEIELQRHGGKSEQNGRLPCTYDHFVEYGVHRQAIAPAIRELAALGFVEVTRKGSAGNERHRQATLFLLTYRHAGSDKRVGDGWRRIKSLEEAEAVAEAARAGKADKRARDFGRRGARARWQKQKSSDGNRTETSTENVPIPGDGNRTEGGKSPVTETVPPLYFPGPGVSACNDAAMPSADPALELRDPPAASAAVDPWDPVDAVYLIGNRRIEVYGSPFRCVSSPGPISRFNRS